MAHTSSRLGLFSPPSEMHHRPDQHQCLTLLQMFDFPWKRSAKNNIGIDEGEKEILGTLTAPPHVCIWWKQGHFCKPSSLQNVSGRVDKKLSLLLGDSFGPFLRCTQRHPLSQRASLTTVGTCSASKQPALYHHTPRLRCPYSMSTKTLTSSCPCTLFALAVLISPALGRYHHVPGGAMSETSADWKLNGLLWSLLRTRALQPCFPSCPQSIAPYLSPRPPACFPHALDKCSPVKPTPASAIRCCQTPPTCPLHHSNYSVPCQCTCLAWKLLFAQKEPQPCTST